ncbi:hypothetical protein BX667DRAFT_397241 [Coemansia mojavensis]|nr:hypothetical protein BX667DRAFT_397241 [Coemansia mojavensis]
MLRLIPQGIQPVSRIRWKLPLYKHRRFLQTNRPDALSEIKGLDQQATTLLSRVLTAGSERQAESIIQRCTELSTTKETARAACAVADRLMQALQKEGELQPGVFAAYVDMYARLGRPDVTQQVMEHVGAWWSRPPLGVFAAQQLALVKLIGDTDGLLLKRTTASSVDAIRSRLAYATVRELVDAQLRRERIMRMFPRLLVYASSAAFAWLAYKWVQTGTYYFAQDGGILRRAGAVAAALGLGALCIRIVLRFSVVGQLTAHDNSVAVWSRSSARCHTRLPAPSARRITQILRRAFPAAPFDRGIDEINALLTAGTSGCLPQMSWPLRAGLQWALIARRLGIIEAPLLSNHGLHQRMALLWLRALPQMSTGSDLVASQEVGQFIGFVKEHFSTTPLLLAPEDARELSTFVAQTATSALPGWLDLCLEGLVSVDPQRLQDDSISRTEFLAHRRACDEAMLFADSADIAKYRSAARILALSTLLSTLTRTHSSLLTHVLDQLLDSTAEQVPLSASLCETAFTAARSIDSFDRANQLVQIIEKRAAQQDAFIQHMITPQDTQVSRASRGWTLPSEHQPDILPIVSCILPYMQWKAQRASDSVLPFVSRWHHLGILSTQAALQCLAFTASSLAISSERAERWSLFACDLACRMPADRSGPLAAPLNLLIAHALKQADSAAALRIYSAWSNIARSHPQIYEAASSLLTCQAFALLVKLASASKDSAAASFVHRALSTLDQMKELGHLPAKPDFDRLCAVAARLHINIDPYVAFWSGPLARKSLNSFANSIGFI